MSVKFNVVIETPGCPCASPGKNGKTTHTAGPHTLFAQILVGGGHRSLAACTNHAHLYTDNHLFRPVGAAVELEKPLPLLKTVYVKSKQTGDIRTLVVRRAVSGQPVWYVQSDSGNEYLVQHRRGIWLCECKHFIARAFGRNETCHHIQGVLDADPEAHEIQSGAEPKLRY